MSLLSKDFKDGTVAEVKEEGESSSVTFKKGNDKILGITFDRSSKKVTKNPGAVESEMRPIHNLKSSVNDYIESKEELFVGKDLDFVYSWKNTNFKTFAYKNQNYFPLSLLDLQISRETGRSFWYLGGLNSVFEVADRQQYLNVGLEFTNKDGETVYRTVETFASEVYKEKYGKNRKKTEI